MTIVNAAGRAMTDVTDDSQLCDVTDDQKPPGTRSYLTVGLPDPHPGTESLAGHLPEECVGHQGDSLNDLREVTLGLEQCKATSRLEIIPVMSGIPHPEFQLSIGGGLDGAVAGKFHASLLPHA